MLMHVNNMNVHMKLYPTYCKCSKADFHVLDKPLANMLYSWHCLLGHRIEWLYNKIVAVEQDHMKMSM